MLRSFLSILFASVLAVLAAAQSKELTVELQADLKSKAIRISGTPELVGLATTAFKTHGAFRLGSSSSAYTLNFTSAGPNQVHVTIGKGEPARTMFNQTVNGTSTRNALFRAADVAVQQLTGAPGYFAGKIAFIGTRTGHREVYTSDLFFGEASQITHDRAHALSPRWSPDGSRIIYTSFFRSGSPDIYVMTPGTGQRTSFASFKGTNSGARFSPDGSRVAAVLSARGIQEIFVANSGGRGFRRLTNSPQGVINAGPAWSPDSSRIIFTSDRNGRPGLFTMSSAGGAVTPVPTGYSSYSAEADWNRVKPNLIAFTAGTAGGGFQIALYDTSTRQSQILTRGADSVEPCWLADGRHLVYTSRSAGVSQLKVLDTDTGKATLISPSSLGKVCQASFLKR